MADPIQIEPMDAEPIQATTQIVVERLPEPAAKWSLPLRIVFRFCVIYFTLFSFSNQILGGMVVIPPLNVPELSGLWPMRHITFWTATHVFHVTRPLVYTGSGSGDKTFDWVLAFWMLILAIVAASVWSVLDRRRTNYVTFHKWFRLFLRFALASEMFLYGFDKLIPLQMPFPFLTRLLEPYGNFSPMAVLWSSVGASRPYEMFAGSAEILGGLLLLAPRTVTFGALVCLADLIQVFTLNMTYDIPVKLFSFHLILFSLFLLAPELRRLVGFFFSDRTVGPSTQPPLFPGRRANRIAIALQVVLGLYLAGMSVFQAISNWQRFGGARPKPSLYGIWNVDEMSIDGQIRSPLLNDYGRWRRIVFDFADVTAFQRMDDSFANYGSAINDQNKTLTLTKFDDKNWKASLAFARTQQDQLTLEGTMDGHKVQLQLRLFDRAKFTLVSRGFHWINEYPFQR